MISCEDGRCKVSGPLTIQNAAGVLEEGKQLFAADGVAVDLGGVTEVDSAAVSLLLEWRRAAEQRNQLLNLPDNLKSLAELYGVTEFIPAG